MKGFQAGHPLILVMAYDYGKLNEVLSRLGATESRAEFSRRFTARDKERGRRVTKFPDPNIVFGYESKVTSEGVLVTFLGGRVKILFKYADIERIDKAVYSGGRISWDVIRWGKCPSGQEALRIALKNGICREHLVVFPDLERAVGDLRSQGIAITGAEK